MPYHPWQEVSLSLLFVSIFWSSISRYHVHADTSGSGGNLAQKLWMKSRRICNLSSMFGSATQSSCPYDRITGHPVFQITTPYGSPYMNMEKDVEEYVQEQASSNSLVGSGRGRSIQGDQNKYRTVALYYLDPDDAVAMYGEMKQMDNMGGADLRILSTSLGKAIRQASNLGNGLTTGMPPNALDGTFQQEEGGYLRYKIMPPKRQLYYAARCHGKERVGLFGERAQDAQTAVMGNLGGMNVMRRRDKRERKTAKARSPLEVQNAHMEGYSGIPVFYAPELRKVSPWLKQVLTGVHHETPLFFNYEDLEQAWKEMRQKQSKSCKEKIIPPEKPFVEVFNLWDVLTSMERDESKKKMDAATTSKSSLHAALEQPIKAIQSRFLISKEQKEDKRRHPELDSITFVPSSRSIQYKEAISARGNGKARLKSMR